MSFLLGKGGAGPLLRRPGDARDALGLVDTRSSQSLSYKITIPHVTLVTRERTGEDGAHNTTVKRESGSLDRVKSPLLESDDQV